MIQDYKRLYESKRATGNAVKAKTTAQRVDNETVKDQVLANRIKNQAKRPQPRV